MYPKILLLSWLNLEDRGLHSINAKNRFIKMHKLWRMLFIMLKILNVIVIDAVWLIWLNSPAGGITANYDLLMTQDFAIVTTYSLAKTTVCEIISVHHFIFRMKLNLYTLLTFLFLLWKPVSVTAEIEKKTVKKVLCI